MEEVCAKDGAKLKVYSVVFIESMSKQARIKNKPYSDVIAAE